MGRRASCEASSPAFTPTCGAGPSRCRPQATRAAWRSRAKSQGPPRFLRGVARAWLVAALLALPAAGAAGATLEGVTFAPSHDAHGTPLALRGAALLRYKVVFKGYVAALYLPPETPSARVLEDVPKRLEIEYFWAIGAADFARATDQGIARNVDAAALAALRPRIQQLNALYQDVEPGDRYALTYAPDRGIELARNGQTLGSVPGADFAAAVFAIWLGDAPLDRDLKRRLLGDVAAR